MELTVQRKRQIRCSKEKKNGLLDCDVQEGVSEEVTFKQLNAPKSSQMTTSVNWSVRIPRSGENRQKFEKPHKLPYGAVMITIQKAEIL